MHTFARPAEKTLSVERTPVEGSCPECGGSGLQSYDALSEGGWWHVVKCSFCLTSVDRTPAPRLGPITPLVPTT
ncbi:hypothetical protein GCM10027416_01170 [Okibacterium endophyticum]